MMRMRRVAPALAAASMLAVVGAGCGSSDEGGGTANVSVLEQAASKTAAASSFHMTTATRQSIQGKTFTVRATGDYAGRRGRMTLDFSDLSKLLDSAPGAGAMLSQLGGTDALKAEMITDRRTLLLKMPALQRALKAFAGKSVPAWASVDIAKLGSTLGIDLGSLFAGSTGSDQAVAYLKSLTGSLKKLGDEDIDGTSTTHYRGSIDFANLPEGAIPQSMRKTMDQVATLMKQQGGTTKVPVDVWVGKDGLVRRQVIEQELKGATSRTTVDFTDYGKPVTVTLPPASQRFDALALIDQLAPGVLGQAGQAIKGGALGTMK